MVLFLVSIPGMFLKVKNHESAELNIDMLLGIAVLLQVRYTVLVYVQTIPNVSIAICR